LAARGLLRLNVFRKLTDVTFDLRVFKARHDFDIGSALPGLPRAGSTLLASLFITSFMVMIAPRLSDYPDPDGPRLPLAEVFLI